MSERTQGNSRELIWPLVLALFIVVVDQLSKWIVTSELGPSHSAHRKELASQLLAIHYVENSGAAFGAFRGQTFVLTVLASAVVVILVVSYRRTRHITWQLATGLGLLLGGALGNLIDRVRLSYVVDFIAISSWPKFNIADSAITIGVILIGWHALAQDHHEARAVHVAPVGPKTLDRDNAS